MRPRVVNTISDTTWSVHRLSVGTLYPVVYCFPFFPSSLFSVKHPLSCSTPSFIPHFFFFLNLPLHLTMSWSSKLKGVKSSIPNFRSFRLAETGNRSPQCSDPRPTLLPDSTPVVQDLEEHSYFSFFLSSV